MNSATAIRKYQQDCFRNYSSSIGLSQPYVYPRGNPIRPLPPIRIFTEGVFIVGAYPSARFESAKGKTSGKLRLIPIADNLEPFGDETYFDGTRVRVLESGLGLMNFVLRPLNLTRQQAWITDLVKVFLYKPEHVDSCSDVFPGLAVKQTRSAFSTFAQSSLSWLERELDLCKPSVVLTLGEEVANAISGSSRPADELLIPRPFRFDKLGKCSVFHLPHPDACRRSPKWQERCQSIIDEIKKVYSPDDLCGTGYDFSKDANVSTDQDKVT